LTCHERELALCAQEAETFSYGADKAAPLAAWCDSSDRAADFPSLQWASCEVMGQDEAGKDVDPEKPVVAGIPDQPLRVVEDLVYDDR
jgi:hypothetical protein